VEQIREGRGKESDFLIQYSCFFKE
jgi:hypothetical protein